MTETECYRLIRKFTKHEYVKITNSGNGAIFTALYLAKKLGYEEVLIPDQGGWLTYPEYPAILGMRMSYIATDRGLLIPETLDAHKNMALLLPSYGGYIAEQPLAELSAICKQNNILLIEDASGAVGHSRLCNGEFSDIIVASFGEAKIVNHGHGGFVSSRTKMAKEIFSLVKPVNIDYSGLSDRLKCAKERLHFLIDKSWQVKKELAFLKVMYAELEGINVAISFKSDEEKMKIIKYCEERGLEHTLCPRYIRVMEPAVSIEIKRLIQ